MRFCFITTFYPPFHFGGDAIYVYRLAHGLADRGHEVEVIHCADAFRIAGGKQGAGWASHTGVRVHTIRSQWGLISPLYTQQTARLGPKSGQVARIIREGRFDVINYHNVSLVGGLEILQHGDALKLYTLHDYWLVCPTHILFRHRREACTRQQCLKCQLVYKRPPQFWRRADRVRQAVAQVDCFIAGSEFAIDLHRERGLDLPFEVIAQMSPSSDEESEAEKPVDSKQGYFLFVGRLEKLKGLQDVLPLFGKNPDLTLRVAGTGTWEQKLRRQASGYRNVQFLGNCSAGRLKTLYRNALATLVPSLCYEISPLVLGESWSQGTPVIARRLGALEEIVGRAAGGCLFGSASELESALRNLATDRSRRRQLGSNGKAYFLSEQTPEIHIERYLDLVDRHLERRQIESISP